VQIRVVNTRDSLDAVPIVLFYIPLGEPLKEWMFWAAMALVYGSGCKITEAMLSVAGEG
jgi:hypothetical protein